MFIAPATAARIDRAEARLAIAIAEAVRLREPAQVRITGIAGGASIRVRPGSPINKIVAAGFDGPLAPDLLAQIEADWFAAGEDVRVELASLADPAAAEQLADRGYRLRGFEHVLVRPLTRDDATREVPAEISIREGDPAWLPTVVDGFAAPDGTGLSIDPLGRAALEAVMHDFVAGAGFRRYTAALADQPAGAAALRVDDDVAILCGASTLPAARRRGVQATLLTARLRDASRAGCELAVVTTEPGSLSQRNVIRHGFTIAYARAILSLPRPA